MASNNSAIDSSTGHTDPLLPVFPSRTLRIVCVSDTHNEDPSERIPHGDILIHAGDMTESGSLVELNEAYRWISSLPHKIKVVVAGNHDLALDPKHSSFLKEALELFTSPDAQRCGIRYLDQEVQVVGLCKSEVEDVLLPIKIYGNPLQPDFLNSTYAFTYQPSPSPESNRSWVSAPQRSESVHIWVTHGPPKNRLDWINVKGLEGCVALAQKVAESRPLLCVFGHYHVSYGVEMVKWHDECDEVAEHEIITKTTGDREYDFSDGSPETAPRSGSNPVLKSGSNSVLKSGSNTVLVNAAWMTGRKRDVPERNDPQVIILSLPSSEP